MLQAYLPLPAFYALYFFGAAQRLWRKLGMLALAGVVLAIVSLSWAVIVDTTPADQRPYVGSSSQNSVLDLAIGYNGASCLLGMRGSLAGWWAGITRQNQNRQMGFGSALGVPAGGRAGAFTGQERGGAFPFEAPQGAPAGALSQAPFASTPSFPLAEPNQQAARSGQRTNPGGTGAARGDPAQPPAFLNGGVAPQAGGGAGNFEFPGGFAGFSGARGIGGVGGTGRAGALRLFVPPLSKEAGWLLPFGLFAAVFLLFRARLRWPVARQHQAALLWGGWLLTEGIFFSVAGFFHEYYLSITAPPLAALVAIGIVELWQLSERHRWPAIALLLAAAGGTLWLQSLTIRAFVRPAWWLPLAVALLALGVLWLVATALMCALPGMAAGFTGIVAALLLTPAIWSGLTAANSSANQSLPAAYSGRASGPANRGGLQIDQGLLSYLEAHTPEDSYLMAVPSSMQGADYVLATGRPVLYLGGFIGQDPVETPERLSALVAEGRLRFIYGETRRGFGQESGVTAWVADHCAVVEGYDTTTVNAGTPDGTYASGAAGGAFQGRGGGGPMQVSLYDCGGAQGDPGQ